MTEKEGHTMANERTTTRRERRIAARKEQILEAAAAVFSEKGYERATTREIADAADVSEGTLYNYFASKRDLLIGLLQERTDEIVEAIADVQTEGIEDMVAQLLVSQLLQIQRRRLFTLFLYEARLDPEIHRYYVEQMLSRARDETEQRMQALIVAGIMRPIDPAIAVRILMGTAMGLAVLLDLGGDAVVESMPPERLAAEVTDVLMSGLRARPADRGEGAL
jgi:AcrR family transcriptional regulator